MIDLIGHQKQVRRVEGKLSEEAKCNDTDAIIFNIVQLRKHAWCWTGMESIRDNNHNLEWSVIKVSHDKKTYVLNAVGCV